jgi:hypothetical protein
MNGKEFRRKQSYSNYEIFSKNVPIGDEENQENS